MKIYSRIISLQSKTLLIILIMSLITLGGGLIAYKSFKKDKETISKQTDNNSKNIEEGIQKINGTIKKILNDIDKEQVASYINYVKVYLIMSLTLATLSVLILAYSVYK